jgi:hypothetical protein
VQVRVWAHKFVDCTVLGPVLLCVYNRVWAAMGTVLNSDTDHAEMLAIHLDTILRGRMGTLSELEIEDFIKTCMQLLRYMVVCRLPGARAQGPGPFPQSLRSFKEPVVCVCVVGVCVAV